MELFKTSGEGSVYRILTLLPEPGTISSFILSAAKKVNSSNSSLLRTNRALARISKHISLKTKSAHPSLASSINSLQAKRTTSLNIPHLLPQISNLKPLNFLNPKSVANINPPSIFTTQKAEAQGINHFVKKVPAVSLFLKPSERLIKLWRNRSICKIATDTILAK